MAYTDITSKSDMYHMGLYLRLSKQDLKGDSSDSIENQKRLLLSFLEDQPDMKVEEIYVDDGLTGTNFVEVR